MSWFRSILDACLEGTARTSLRLLGRATTADEDTLLKQDDRDQVILRCHDLARNNPIASGVSIGIADNVVGSAFRVQARTRNAEWNRQAEQWFNCWARSAEVTGKFDLTEILRLCCTTRLFDGEIFLVPQEDGTLALVESERVRSPNSTDLAYRTDEYGKLTSFFVVDRDLKTGAFSPLSLDRGYWVSDAIHVAWRWRADQVRGWPQLATVANICTDVGEINMANLKKYKMGALAAWTLTGGGQLRGRNPSVSGVPLAKFREGLIYELEAGQSLQPFVNNQPGGEYAPFVELNLRLIGMALRLPYEFLLMYFGGGTFASSKASLLQTHKTIQSWQQWLWKSAIHPIIAWRIAKAIADGELPEAPTNELGESEWDRWEWQKPSLDWIDPQNAIQTEMQEVRMGTKSLSAVASSRGNDLEEVLRQRAQEIRLCNEIANEYGISPSQLCEIQIPGQSSLYETKEEMENE